MTEILEAVKDFTVSRPVFRIKPSHRDNSLSVSVSDPIYKYRPEPVKGDIISELACAAYRENFSSHYGEFTCDTDSIADACMREIRASMANFLEKNLPMKSPTQSKLYRWTARELPKNSYFNDKLVSLYKYMRTFCDDGMSANKDADQKHVDNTIAILGAIMEKYNDEN